MEPCTASPHRGRPVPYRHRRPVRRV